MTNPVTNTQLAQLVNEALTKWNAREAEQYAWVSGSATGGPNNDGRYPLSNGSGTTALIDSPAKLADLLNGPAATAVTAKNLALTYRDAAEAAAVSAGNDRGLANNHRLAAQDHKDLAKQYRDDVAAHRSTVEVWKDQVSANALTVSAHAADVEAFRDEVVVLKDDALAAKVAAEAAAVLAATFNPNDYYTKTAADARYLQSTNFTWTNLSGKPSTFTPSAHTHVISEVTGLQSALDGKQAAGSYSVTGHGHVISDVSGLQTALDGKQPTGNYSLVGHGHVIADVSGLQTALDGKQAAGSYVTTTNFTWANLSGKPATFTPSAHVHSITDVTGLQTALDGKQAAGSYVTTVDFTWANLSGKPTTFTPSAHTHVIADVTGLQTALDGKQAAGSYAASVHVHAIADVTGLQTALDGKAASSHTHTIAQVTGLQTALDGKQASGNYSLVGHSHVIADVTGLQAALDGKQAAGSYVTTANFTWANLSGKPTTFTPSAHTHVISDVTGLQTALDGKQAAGSYAASVHSHAIGDVTGLSTQLTSKVTRRTGEVSLGVQTYGVTAWCADGATGAGFGGWARHLSVKAGELDSHAGFFAVYGWNTQAEEVRIGVGNADNGYTQGNALRITSSEMSWNGSSVWHGGNFSPASKSDVGHTHVIADVTGLQTALDGKQAAGSYVTTTNFTWANLSGKPSTFAPSAHTHVISDVTGLQTALDGKQAAGSYAPAVHVHDYLPLSGGIVGGTLEAGDFLVKYSSAATWASRIAAPWEHPAEVLNMNENGFSAITFHVVNKYANLFGYDENNILKTNNSVIWHSGNFNPGDKSDVGHVHTIANVTGLQAALDGKQAAGSYAAASHTHDYLPLSGGSLSGNLNVTGTAGANSFGGFYFGQYLGDKFTVGNGQALHYGLSVGDFNNEGNASALLAGYYGLRLATAGAVRLTIDTSGYITIPNTVQTPQINLGDTSKFIRGGGAGQTILGVGDVNSAFLQVGGSYYSIWNAGNFDPTTKSNVGHTHSQYATVFSDNNFARLFTTGVQVNGLEVFPSRWTNDFQSSSDFVNGTLVVTDIPANVENGDSFEIEITGKSYNAAQPPFKVIAQGYIYANTFISASGISYGGQFADSIKVMERDGVLCFWWPRISYWNSFRVSVVTSMYPSNDTITRNRVTSIIDIAEPSVSKKVTITLEKSIRANTAGNVLLGPLSANRRLSVTGTSNAYSSFWAGDYRSFTLGTDSNGFILYDDNVNQYRMVVAANGNLGVGTAGPGNRLHVLESASQTVARFESTLGTSFISLHTGAAQTFLGSDSAGALLVQTPGSGYSTKLFVGASGNVGVGTTSPNNLLQSSYGVSASVPSSGAGGHGFAVGSFGYGLTAGALTSGNGYLQVTRWDGSAANYHLMLQPNGGSVAVGNINPVTSIDTAGDITARGGNLFIRENPAGAGAGMRLHHTGGGAYIDFDGDLNFRDGDGSLHASIGGGAFLSNYVTALVSVAAQASGSGRVSMQSGNASNPGYLQWNTSDGVRRGYLGWAEGTNIVYQAEAGWGLKFNTNFSVSGTTTLNGQVNSNGQIRATGWWLSPVASATALGVEIGATGSNGYVYSYNRDTSTYGPLRLGGSTIIAENPMTFSSSAVVSGAASFGSTVDISGGGLRIFSSGGDAAMGAYVAFRNNVGERGWVGYGEGTSRMRVYNGIGDVLVQGSSTQIDSYGGGNTRISTTSGYVEVGPLNTSYCHFNTDRPAFYFGQRVEFQAIPLRYGQGAFLHHSSTSLGSGVITVSTASPSGGSDGDIWIKVAS